MKLVLASPITQNANSVGLPKSGHIFDLVNQFYIRSLISNSYVGTRLNVLLEHRIIPSRVVVPFCEILMSARCIRIYGCIQNAGLNKGVDKTLLASYFRVARASDASFAYTKCRPLIIGPQLQNHLV